MNTTTKKWYAVYTKPRWEKKVSELLTKKQIDNYCPLNRVKRKWSDRTKIILEPLFTSYVFVSITDAEHLEIRKTDGIINFVYFLSKPAVIRKEEIIAIKDFLATYDNIQLNKASVNINDRVCITEGALTHMEGNVLELRKKTVVVVLPSLGYKLVAEVERSHVKVIQAQGDKLVYAI
jgi:transcription antitermination factor NusG